jgi:uncharacterized membrane-anchored protein YhcB (DUF1043 family)
MPDAIQTAASDYLKVRRIVISAFKVCAALAVFYVVLLVSISASQAVFGPSKQEIQKLELEKLQNQLANDRYRQQMRDHFGR